MIELLKVRAKEVLYNLYIHACLCLCLIVSLFLFVLFVLVDFFLFFLSLSLHIASFFFFSISVSLSVYTFIAILICLSVSLSLCLCLCLCLPHYSYSLRETSTRVSLWGSIIITVCGVCLRTTSLPFVSINRLRHRERLILVVMSVLSVRWQICY